MTFAREQINRWAREVGYFLRDLTKTHGIKTVETDEIDQWEQLERFAALVAQAARAAENEACAKVCEEYAVFEHAAHHLFEGMPGKQLEKTSKAQGADECAAAIRARIANPADGNPQ